MVCGHPDILWRGVDARHLCAQPGERLGEQSGAAAHIDRAPVSQRVTLLAVETPMGVDRRANIAKPRGIEPVQHR